eukprot:3285787-Amphidinium_carterae.1
MLSNGWKNECLRSMLCMHGLGANELVWHSRPPNCEVRSPRCKNLRAANIETSKSSHQAHSSEMNVASPTTDQNQFKNYLCKDSDWLALPELKHRTRP